MKIDVKILDNRLIDQLPAHATPGSAGLDLRACLSEPLTLAPNAWQLVPTGIAIYLKDSGYAALILPFVTTPLVKFDAPWAMAFLSGSGRPVLDLALL